MWLQRNGAIVHYRAPEEGSATVRNEGILLLDSGGQYLDGTISFVATYRGKAIAIKVCSLSSVFVEVDV